jgi:hypothetical protein
MRTSMVACPLCLPLCGQTTARLAGFGDRNPPVAIEAAPGQVLIVSLYGAPFQLAGAAAIEVKEGTAVLAQVPIQMVSDNVHIHHLV